MAQNDGSAPRLPAIGLKIDVPTSPSNAIPRIVENFPCPEILVDGISSMGLNINNIKLTFFSERQSLDGSSVERAVVCRLAMSTHTAYSVAETLRTVLQRLAENGSIPPLPEVNIT